MKHNIINKLAVTARRTILLLLAPCSLLLSGCSDEDYFGGHYVTDGEGTLMTVTAHINASTAQDLAWAEGDIIGISATYGITDMKARNREYACQADGLTFTNTADFPIYVKGTTDIVAYYPFIGTDQAEPVIRLNTTDQQNIVDYLFAKVEGVTPQAGGNVTLNFDYALARVQFNITSPAGETITGYRLTGLVQQAEVDPYSLNMTLSDPEDLTATGTDIRNISLRLIPQTLNGDAAIPARLVLIGKNRSYSIDLSELTLTGGQLTTANIDVTDGVGYIEFIPNGATWTDSGVGGNVTSNT